MSAPAPPVPADTDLRSFRYFAIDVSFSDSDIVQESDGEEFQVWFTLLLKSWHQVPAGSLPADERRQARLAGFGRDVAGYQAIGVRKLMGWKLHADGRLYNPLMTAKVQEAIGKRARTAQAVEARKRSRAAHVKPSPRTTSRAPDGTRPENDGRSAQSTTSTPHVQPGMKGMKGMRGMNEMNESARARGDGDGDRVNAVIAVAEDLSIPVKDEVGLFLGTDVLWRAIAGKVGLESAFARIKRVQAEQSKTAQPAPTAPH